MESSDALLARFLALHPKTIDLSLGRIERLLAALGHPERRLPPVIHVGGTNGKGSTIAFMRAILEAAGLVVHVYTSPHLVRFHERIRLGRPGGGRYVDEERLVAVLRRCEEVNAGEPITVFEITTAAAFVLFAETPADVLLLEVGLGGRYDATNVVDDPAAAVVTPVSMDHADYLGDTVALIAAEKAGIFKPGVPAIVAPQELEAGAVLEAHADRIGARLLMGGQDFSVHEEGGRLVYQDEHGLLDLPLPRLVGRHQQINAGTAIAALRAAGFGRLPVSAFETGLLKAEWPARMQRLARGQLPELAPAGAEIWLDGAHNPDGGRVVASAMAELEERSPAPLVLVVGMLGTKDADGFLKPFAGLARELLAVPIPSQLAARPAEEVAEIARNVGLTATVHASVEAALAALNGFVWERPPRILITGSLYLAGDVLAANGTPPQ
ncbi:folylpolyglutamate synthase/dihydrofolate synthase family protein [Chelatococcus sp. SYSU_G07232]|uniref:Dihydrofolate synthase/folylpolyglutamate synthase n=1 Tax=Chelatococcus albus TaxID=3047466 RepID=A0ABT7AII2_9HYPH|nr:folylpolyglutamate synthase/dihydrofolate synthase family protein [Chelatococcus sp. SYSU_G07232]MDJ1158890.1 folylpolyglutamate synthase/dihydrofolate synthase family protein [Chelatococcus sp. SYSU_G07232]